MSEQIMDLNELMQVRMEKMDELKEKGINPFGDKFEPTHKIRILIELKAIESQEEVL